MSKFCRKLSSAKRKMLPARGEGSKKVVVARMMARGESKMGSWDGIEESIWRVKKWKSKSDICCNQQRGISATNMAKNGQRRGP